MTYQDVKELIHMINESDFVNFELVMDTVSLKMSKCAPVAPIEINAEAVTKVPVIQEASADKSMMPEAASIITKESVTEVEGNLVKSPIVGTFYASTNPDKPPIVSKGSKVKKGDILCIVEAMKIMNEIVSDCDGEVVEILAENGQLVEYGQPLFRIV